MTTEVTGNTSIESEIDGSYITKARKYAALLALCGVVLFLIGAADCLGTGQTRQGLVILPPLMMSLGSAGLRDPRVFIALSGRWLFPAAVRRRMPGGARKTGCIALYIGCAVALLIRFSLFQ